MKGINVLGVSTSPERGASRYLVRAALLGAEAAGATTDFVPFDGKTVTPCNGCGPCLEAGHCVIDDDMSPVYEKLLWADAVIIGTPVYFGLPSAVCKAFLERVEGLGIEEKVLRFKVGGAIAVASSDHGGQESAMAALHLWFQINEMLPIGVTTPGAGLGVGGRSPLPGSILTERVRSTTSDRTISVAEASWLYGRKIATVASIVQAGLESSGLDLPDLPYGGNLPDEFPAAVGALTL